MSASVLARKALGNVTLRAQLERGRITPKTGKGRERAVAEAPAPAQAQAQAAAAPEKAMVPATTRAAVVVSLLPAPFNPLTVTRHAFQFVARPNARLPVKVPEYPRHPAKARARLILVQGAKPVPAPSHTFVVTKLVQQTKKIEQLRYELFTLAAFFEPHAVPIDAALQELVKLHKKMTECMRRKHKYCQAQAIELEVAKSINAKIADQVAIIDNNLKACASGLRQYPSLVNIARMFVCDYVNGLQQSSVTGKGLQDFAVSTVVRIFFIGLERNLDIIGSYATPSIFTNGNLYQGLLGLLHTVTAFQQEFVKKIGELSAVAALNTLHNIIALEEELKDYAAYCPVRSELLFPSLLNVVHEYSQQAKHCFFIACRAKLGVLDSKIAHSAKHLTLVQELYEKSDDLENFSRGPLSILENIGGHLLEWQEELRQLQEIHVALEACPIPERLQTEVTALQTKLVASIAALSGAINCLRLAQKRVEAKMVVVTSPAVVEKPAALIASVGSWRPPAKDEEHPGQNTGIVAVKGRSY